MIGDQDAQLVGADAAAAHEVPAVGRPVLSFNDTDEEAAITAEVAMPGQYAGGTLKATIFLFTASDNTNDAAFDVFVEAVTALDTLDIQATADWDTANSGTVSVSGTTAGDLVALTITLTNKDSVAKGDMVRFGIRRDCDSGDDDIVGDVFVTTLEIWEDT